MGDGRPQDSWRSHLVVALVVAVIAVITLWIFVRMALNYPGLSD
jgi:hypothetical protein